MLESMKFTLSSSALETFNRDRQVEIEGFYDADLINAEIERLLKGVNPREAMVQGRDLFRKSETLHKALQLSALGKVIYELIAVRPLRFAADQLLVSAEHPIERKEVAAFLKKTGSLKERSCLSEVVLGAMIALKAKEERLPFSKTAGNVVFFDPDISVPVEWLAENLGDRYWLLTFTTLHAQYIYNDRDPQNHYLKHLGYVYGDKLKDTLSPVIFR